MAFARSERASGDQLRVSKIGFTPIRNAGAFHSLCRLKRLGEFTPIQKTGVFHSLCRLKRLGYLNGQGRAFVTHASSRPTQLSDPGTPDRTKRNRRDCAF